MVRKRVERRLALVDEAIVIVTLGNPIAADYARHCQQQGRHVFVIAARDVCEKIDGPSGRYSAERLSLNDCAGLVRACRQKRLVVFLGRRCQRELLETVIGMVHEVVVDRICVVSTWKVHFEDRTAIRVENAVLRMLQGLAARVVILRPSHVLSPHSELGHVLQMSWLLLLLVPARLKGCSLPGEELFATIEQELRRTRLLKNRTYTLLGANRPWRIRLLENLSGESQRYLLAITSILVPLAVFRFLLGWLISLIAPRTHWLTAWHTETLRPRSRRELLALYNPYNHRHVKIVGYNNGVVHFGQRFPGKTIISTVLCNQRARVRGDVAEFDAGVTIRQVTAVLDSVGKQLHVVPNYSYVSLATAFFIPIHGSASMHSTIAQTIEKVVLYDPVRDRFLIARRGEPTFGQFVYNQTAEVLLLRMAVQTTKKATYFVRKREVVNPSSQEIIAAFHDNTASNVEIRKAGSTTAIVQVYQYFTDKGLGKEAALELPRDALGQLWDRLEENPLTSFLFHGLTRWLAYHTELFLSEQEFARFWKTHRTLPVRKIQLRYIRRDGWPHSAFRDHNCISADLFLLKKHRELFKSYLKQTLPLARMNPGKHGM
jgi:hypothetical protein